MSSLTPHKTYAQPTFVNDELKTPDTSEMTKDLKDMEEYGIEAERMFQESKDDDLHAVVELILSKPRRTLDPSIHVNIAMYAAIKLNNVACLKVLFEHTKERDENLCLQAAKFGHTDCLALALKEGCILTTSEVHFTAACRGDLECLKMAFHAYPVKDDTITQMCANGGHIDCLAFAFEVGFPRGPHIATAAAATGQLACLRWLYNEKPPNTECLWDYNTTAAAAEGGHLDCVKFLIFNSCPWSVHTPLNALKEGHLEIFEFCYYFDCPIGERVTNAVLKKGDLDFVSFIIRRKLNLHHLMTMILSKYGNAECLEYVLKSFKKLLLVETPLEEEKENEKKQSKIICYDTERFNNNYEDYDLYCPKKKCVTNVYARSLRALDKKSNVVCLRKNESMINIVRYNLQTSQIAQYAVLFDKFDCFVVALQHNCFVGERAFYGIIADDKARYFESLCTHGFEYNHETLECIVQSKAIGCFQSILRMEGVALTTEEQEKMDMKELIKKYLGKV